MTTSKASWQIPRSASLSLRVAFSHPTGQSQRAKKPPWSVQVHSSVHVTHRAVTSWLGRGDDGGHHRCHPFRNDQVRTLAPFSLPANTHALERNSSTMPSVRIPNTAVSYTAPRPSYDKKVLRAYTEVYSPSYVHYVYLYPPRPASRLDDETRRQFGCSLHDVYHSQAVRSVHRTPGTTASNRNHVWYRCHCRSRDGICHATPRVRLVSFSCSNVRLTCGIVSSRRACSLSMLLESIKTRSTVVTGS